MLLQHWRHSGTLHKLTGLRVALKPQVHLAILIQITMELTLQTRTPLRPQLVKELMSSMQVLSLELPKLGQLARVVHLHSSILLSIRLLLRLLTLAFGIGRLVLNSRSTNMEPASPFSSSSVESLKILGNGAAAQLMLEVIMHSSIAPLVDALTAVINKISSWKDLYTLTMLLPSFRD